MTREEATDVIRWMLVNWVDSEDKHKALQMAIEALGQSECKDTIYRQAVIDALKEHRNIFCDNTPVTFSTLPYGDKCRVDEIDNAIATLINLPSAQPELRWIPVTERLPENREWVLGIFQEGDAGWINPIPFICDYVGKKTPITTQDNWLLKMVDEPHPYYEKLHCIAWMPLPAPYQKEGEADD